MSSRSLCVSAAVVLALASPAHADQAKALKKLEKEGLAFHNKLRQGFKAIARSEPERCKLIDASADADAVADAIRTTVMAHFGLGARLVAS